MDTNNKHTNHLIDSTSPYLLQHAHNPVDWYPWGNVAWDLAKKMNKPVLVSIGYSACHWCHVMERECFEDEETAEIMNRWFVNIKVDREERPDVDMIYMDACQMMTGRGGWPLNVICLPDQKPIFAGTYFPKESWQQTLLQIQALWANEQDKAIGFGDKMLEGIKEMSLVEMQPDSHFSRADISAMHETFCKNLDYVDGGQNRAPKFPMPNNYEYLLDQYLLSENKSDLDFLHLTLLKMANGGIYDHLRGGFYRYSTDRFWFAPHFEKMLYDNAQLIGLYARAFAISDAPIYKEIVAETIDFCLRELRGEHPGFYAALDADSEGVEGRYYVFTDAELKNILSENEYAFATVCFGLKPQGNWEHGYNILHKPLAPLQILEKTGLTANEFLSQLSQLKTKLRQSQENRVRPGLDDKIICAWNGLMLEGLSKAALYGNEKTWLEKAIELGQWLWNNLQKEGKLCRLYDHKKFTIPGFSEDYACLIRGYLALYEADGNNQWLRYAEILANTLIADFYDGEQHLFLFSGRSSEQLIANKADLSDDVISSSNSMLCLDLQKLGLLLDQPEFLAIGEGMLNGVRQQATKYPAWYSGWARAAQSEAYGLLQVKCTTRHRTFFTGKLPSWSIVSVDDSADKIMVCSGTVCHEPVLQPEQAMEIVHDILGIHP